MADGDYIAGDIQSIEAGGSQRPSSLSAPSSPNTNEIATLAANFQAIEKRVEIAARDMESAKNISFLGFAILLVMVAAMVFGAIWQYSATVSILFEKMGSLEERTNQFTAVSSSSTAPLQIFLLPIQNSSLTPLKPLESSSLGL